MNKYIATVYPYQRAFAPYVSSFARNISCSCEIKTLVSPKGFPYLNKDAGYVDHRGDTGFTVCTDFLTMLQQANSLLIPEGDYTIKLYDDIMKKAIIAAQMGKHILCAQTLKDNDDEQLLSSICRLHQVDFIYARQKGRESSKRFAIHAKNKISARLYRPEAPIVFVGEIYENTNAKDIVLILVNHFLASGYKVSVVMEPGFSQLIGFHGTDEFLDSEAKNEIDSITTINRYFESLEKLEQPDIILVQVPGGMMKYNDIIHNSYGVFAYMLSQAIAPDCFICCLPFDEYYSNAIKMYSDLLNSRFGYSITCAHISNLFIDASNLTEYFQLDRVFLSQDKINNYIKESMSDSEIPIVNSLDHIGQQFLCKRIEETLLSYNDATAL
ncbi:MAG: TIGR04066 family peptide maturation system protein [Oscillospiraceae bacterium]|jgi:peptide maturation system protein (TIGR04066 family)|nr:TIGR04066 family peptide maturation system protein [Oscillospiraceae bacterium]